MSDDTDATAAIEGVFYTTTDEDVTLRLQPGLLLAEGTTPLVPTNTFIRVDTKTPVTCEAPTISGTDILQHLPELRGGVSYRLRVSIGTGGNRRVMTVYIECLR